MSTVRSIDKYDPGWVGGDVIRDAYLRGFRLRRLASSLTYEELQNLRALYAGKVTLVDRWVGKLLNKIRDLGPSTSIVISNRFLVPLVSPL
jgi:hypothetical protein